MADRQQETFSKLPALVMLVGGVVLLGGAWFLPANLRSLNPILLERAGQGTPGVVEAGMALVRVEKPGPARLMLAAAEWAKAPRAPDLETALADLKEHSPELTLWGGRERWLDQVLSQTLAAKESQPALNLVLPEKARRALGQALENSPLASVQGILQTRQVTGTTNFLPALKPGGQPLEATILLAAYLYQAERFSPTLAAELKQLADQAAQSKTMGSLEGFYLDLLVLGKRLDLNQLSELVRLVPDTRTFAQFSQQVQQSPADLPLLYAAALLSRSPDRVVQFLIRSGAKGIADLGLSVRYGQGGVNHLLARQLPLKAAPAFEPLAVICIENPQLALGIKFGLFLVGGFLVLRGLQGIRPRAAEALASPPALPALIAALLFGLVLVFLSEPFLFRHSPTSAPRSLIIPVLEQTPSALAKTSNLKTPMNLDTTTILSITVFLLLQVLVYVICLLKISEIDRQSLPSHLKLRLMENEENLFDTGLYVGIGGTAAALVLQVMGLIEANLLAAYSSNLFGITCVALVKIRHVRHFKRRLIVESQKTEVPA